MSRSSPLLPFALFEDNQRECPSARLLSGLQTELSCTAADNVAACLDSIAQWLAEGLHVALAAHYELGLALEPRLQSRLPSGTQLLRAWAFENQTILSGPALDAWWASQLEALNPQERSSGLLRLDSTLVFDDYRDAFEQIQSFIARGDCYQINLTFPLLGQYFGHPLSLFAKLRDTQPVSHGVLLYSGEDWILSRSPELFVEKHGDTLRCRPMKGTVPRDNSLSAADARTALLSDKNRAENLMIVDLIRNDLGRLAPAGGVSVSSLFEVETYRSVYQLTSTVEASPVKASLRDIMQALFPCGSVTGAPKIRAMQLIDELEKSPRGLYCGALGWLAPNGDFSLNVPIRTLLCAPDFSCRLNVGSGVVADSIAADEFAECHVKAGFVHAIGDELRLIETMCYTPDSRSIPLLELHLARLTRSASELGFKLDLEAVQAALVQQLSHLSAHKHRVRLSLSRAGHIELSVGVLDQLSGPQVVRISSDSLTPSDPRLRHKTSAREFYDSALGTAMTEGLFDLLFFNTRGELCEGARSNVFIEKQGHMLTPALECGLLPGVLRASLLAQGKVRETILHEQDLREASRIWLGNALRGLVEVSLNV